MSTTNDNKNAKRKRGVVAGKFYPAPISVNKKHVTIRLPRKVAEYFNLVGDTIFWAPVNGIIQLSPSSQPHMALSALNVSADQFLPHDAKVVDAGK